MRTVRSSGRISEGVVLSPGGMSAPGGVSAPGGLCLLFGGGIPACTEAYNPLWTDTGGVCSQGVSAAGGVCPRGVSAPGGVVSQHALRQMSGYHVDTPITIKAEAIHEADSCIH